MKIALIVNGGQEMGMGNIVRGLTLAEELQTKAEIIFVTKSDDIVVSQIKEAGFNIYRLDNNDEKLSLLQGIKPDVVVFDRLEVPEGIAKGLKDSLGMRLVIFDNLSKANKYADVVVNCVMGSGCENKIYLDKETNTIYFYGLKYEVLRKEFYQYRKSHGSQHEVKKILLIFGGSDPLNLTTVSLGELLRLGRDYMIDVVIGVHFRYFKELSETIKKYPDKMWRVKLHKNVKNIAELMFQSDLVLASPGLSVFEALCVGTPVIPINQNELQRYWFGKFMQTLNKNEIWKLGDIISKGEYADPFGEYIRSLEVGKGKDEVIKAIAEGIAK